jgi:hypothetical protein
MAPEKKRGISINLERLSRYTALEMGKSCTCFNLRQPQDVSREYRITLEPFAKVPVGHSVGRRNPGFSGIFGPRLSPGCRSGRVLQDAP